MKTGERDCGGWSSFQGNHWAQLPHYTRPVWILHQVPSARRLPSFEYRFLNLSHSQRLLTCLEAALHSRSWGLKSALHERFERPKLLRRESRERPLRNRESNLPNRGRRGKGKRKRKGRKRLRQEKRKRRKPRKRLQKRRRRKTGKRERRKQWTG